MFNKKYILIIDSILLVGILASAFLLIGYSRPLVIAPLSSEQGNILFNLPNVDYILIDSTSAFDSPDTIFLDKPFDLEKGRYFLKFFYGAKSEIREIRFELDVRLELRNIDSNNSGIFNIGQNDLNIDTYNTGSLVNSSLAKSGGLDE